MKFSAFTPFGHFRFTSKRPHGESIYFDKLRNVGAEENFREGGIYRGKLYCDAMLAAGVLYKLEAVGRQFDPRKAYELLTTHEREWGLVPAATATVSQRRTALYNYRRLRPDARISSVGQALYYLLGDKLINYRVMQRSEIAIDELLEIQARYGATTTALMVDPKIPMQIGRLKRGLHKGGVTRKLFEIEWLFGGNADLARLQKIIIDPGKWSRSEVVTIAEVLGDNTYRAATRNPHVEGAYVMTSLFPLNSSRKRRHFIRLQYPWASDRETRRAIHNVMKIVTRSVSTWQIMDGPDDEVGPFKVGVGRLGITPLGVFT
jgi:hypothetical protein